MAVEFKLPDLGENIESGDVVSLLVAVGDTLDEDQPILELETDKAVIEVPSPVAGIVQEIHVQAGDKAAVGQLILTLEERETSGGEAPAPEEERAEPASPQPADAPELPSEEAKPVPREERSLEFRLPDLGENVEGGDVVSLLVAVGDTLDEDQPILELETDKAVVEVPSPVAGTIEAIHVQAGDKAAVGQLILTVSAAQDTDEGAQQEETPAEEPATSAAPEVQPPPSSTPAQPSAPTATNTYPAPVSGPRKLVPASPSVRRLAREIGVDIAQVHGSGRGGRISEDDVKAHARQLNTARPAGAVAAAVPAAELPDFAQWGEVEIEPMSNVRRVTAERMHRAWSTIPQVTQFDKTDITDLERWRKQYGPKAAAAGGKLTPTAIILKVIASALKAFPKFNASIDMANQQLIYKQYCHIGVAVDTDRGLLVPVIRDVDQKNIIELAVELGQIAEKSRSRKLTPADMQGGCFTISNLGGIGGTAFTPIVNPPEVAILGVARGGYEPQFVDGEFLPRMMLPLSLSYDHRLIDGADGARFLRWVAQALENPFLLVLEG